MVLTFCLTPSPTRVLRSFLSSTSPREEFQCVSEYGVWEVCLSLKNAPVLSCLQLLPTSPLSGEVPALSRFLWRKLPLLLVVLPTAGSSLRPEGLQSQLLPVLHSLASERFCLLLSSLSSPIWLLVLFVF